MHDFVTQEETWYKGGWMMNGQKILCSHFSRTKIEVPLGGHLYPGEWDWMDRILFRAPMSWEMLAISWNGIFWYQWNLDHGIKNRKDVLNTNGVFSQSISRGWEIENCSHHQLDLHPSLTKKPDSLARALNHFRCMNIIEYDMMFTVFGEI